MSSTVPRPATPTTSQICLGDGSNLQSIPPELTDIIIDHLHGDPKGLVACSLVCKAWLSATRYHLFTKVFLNLHNSQSFFALLHSPNATFRSSIHAISLRGEKNKDSIVWCNTTFPSLAALPDVTALSIEDLSEWSSIEEDVKAGFFSHFRSITHIEIRGWRAMTPMEIVDTLSAFPALEEIRLGRIFVKQWTPFPNSSRPSVCAPSSLRRLSLSIAFGDVKCIFDWLSVGGPPTALDTLRLDLHPANRTFINPFLRALGPILRIFNLRAFTDGDLDLRHNTRLHTLNLELVSLHPTALSPLPSVISRIDSPSIREISFSFFLHTKDDLKSFDWDGLALTLDSKRLAPLQQVVFKIDYMQGGVVESTVVDEIRGRLRSCCERGILQIRTNPIGKPIMLWSSVF